MKRDTKTRHGVLIFWKNTQKLNIDLNLNLKFETCFHVCMAMYDVDITIT